MSALLKLFKRFPLTTLIAYGTTALAVLVVLQSSGVLTGTVAKWVDAAAGALQVVLTAYAKMHVTPLTAPKDASGRKLAPVSMRATAVDRRIGPKCSHGYVFGSPESHHCGELPSDAR